MPTPAEKQALEKLRLGINPFATRVSNNGTAAEDLQASVPELTAEQLSELLAIMELYRKGRPATRVYPLVGDRGTGKTHLLHAMRAAVLQRAIDSGDETMLVIVDRLTTGMDPIDYLLWQIVNHLLAPKGDGLRMLRAIAARVTGRLLAEGLRSLAPQQQVELIPASGFWDQLRLRMGSSSRIQDRLDRVGGIIEVCTRENSTCEDLQQACKDAGISPAVALEIIEQHLERTESKDILGWLRKRLYLGLARFGLQGEREPFEDVHTGNYEDAPPNVKNAGNLSRRLLETWIELLASIHIPVVVVFDQLEDYIRSPDPEQEKANRRYFTGAMALFVNELKNVCIIIFAEEGFWIGLINQAEAFAADRLKQPIALPGQASKPYLKMPTNVKPEIIKRLIHERLGAAYPDLDFTSLPSGFPFSEADIARLKNEPAIRFCLQKLAKTYDDLVYVVRTPPDLEKILRQLWSKHFTVAESNLGAEMEFRVAFIPEVQNALQGWLECLHRHGLTGSPPWVKVEMISDPTRQLYGNISVIRTAGGSSPGVGIAAWLGKKRAQSYDLKQRIGFFDLDSCPIQTLVMLRADGEDALVGETGAVYERAIDNGLDVRIQQYQPKDMYSLMAFDSWYQAAVAEVENARDLLPDADTLFRQFLAKLSAELLAWIDAWRQPKTAVGTAKAAKA